MSDGIIDSSMLLNLSNDQQEVLVGGSDFELSGSNFAHRLAALRGITASGPTGSYASSAAAKKSYCNCSTRFPRFGRSHSHKRRIARSCCSPRLNFLNLVRESQLLWLPRSRGAPLLLPPPALICWKD